MATFRDRPCSAEVTTVVDDKWKWSFNSLTQRNASSPRYLDAFSSPSPPPSFLFRGVFFFLCASSSTISFLVLRIHFRCLGCLLLKLAIRHRPQKDGSIFKGPVGFLFMFLLQPLLHLFPPSFFTAPPLSPLLTFFYLKVLECVRDQKRRLESVIAQSDSGSGTPTSSLFPSPSHMGFPKGTSTFSYTPERPLSGQSNAFSPLPYRVQEKPDSDLYMTLKEVLLLTSSPTVCFITIFS